MKQYKSHNPLLRSGVFAALLLTSVSFLDAGVRERSGSFQGARGNSGNWGTKVERGQGFRNVERNGAGERGNWSSQRQSAWDCESGAGQSSWSRTGPEGRTASGSSSVQRTDTGATYERSRTNPDGSTASASGTMTKGEDGSRTYETVRTNREGGVATSTRTVTPTETGRTISGRATGANGQSHDWSTTVERDGEGTRTRSTEVTNEAGETASRTGIVTRGDGSVTQTVNRTNFEGETRTRTRLLTIEPAEE